MHSRGHGWKEELGESLVSVSIRLRLASRRRFVALQWIEQASRVDPSSTNYTEDYSAESGGRTEADYGEEMG